MNLRGFLCCDGCVQITSRWHYNGNSVILSEMINTLWKRLKPSAPDFVHMSADYIIIPCDSIKYGGSELVFLRNNRVSTNELLIVLPNVVFSQQRVHLAWRKTTQMSYFCRIVFCGEWTFFPRNWNVFDPETSWNESDPPEWPSKGPTGFIWWLKKLLINLILSPNPPMMRSVFIVEAREEGGGEPSHRANPAPCY